MSHKTRPVARIAHPRRLRQFHATSTFQSPTSLRNSPQLPNFSTDNSLCSNYILSLGYSKIYVVRHVPHLVAGRSMEIRFHGTRSRNTMTESWLFRRSRSGQTRGELFSCGFRRRAIKRKKKEKQREREREREREKRNGGTCQRREKEGEEEGKTRR